MIDQYGDRAGAVDAPAGGAFPIIANDESNLSHVTRAVYVGGGGTLVAQMLRGETVSFENLPDGALLPIRIVKVLAATTASAMIGLY